MSLYKVNDKPIIETERLRLIPLNLSQLEKYIRCDNSLETELGLNENSRTISEDLKEALEMVILPNVADESKNYLYSTIWTGILKKENKMVGDLCFYGEPNDLGQIEIGYGTYGDFQGKGIMTELISGILNWVQTQNKVKSVIATTEKTNTASAKVLLNNKFNKVGGTEEFDQWELSMLN